MLFDRETLSKGNKGMQLAQENGFFLAGSTSSVLQADLRQQGGILIIKREQNREIRGEKEANKWNGLIWRQGTLEEEYPSLKQIHQLCFGESN